jgi:hypothetical protein
MSSPIFRNSKLRELELYGPRRAERRSVFPDHATPESQAPSDDQAACENETTSNDQAAFTDPSASSIASEPSESDQLETTESLTGRHEIEGAAIDELLAQVINEAIERKHMLEDRTTAEPEVKGPEPFSVAAARDADADRKLLPASLRPTPRTPDTLISNLASARAVRRSVSPDHAVLESQAPSEDQTASENETTSNDQATFADPLASPTASEPGENDQPDTTESLAGSHEIEGTATDDWLAEVIREAIERKHVVEDRATNAPQVKDLQPLSVAPAEDAGGDHKLLLPPSQRPTPGTPNPPISNLTPTRAVLPSPRLEPEIVPEPRASMRRSGVFRPVVWLSLVMIFAAIMTYGLIAFSPLLPHALRLTGENDHVANISSSLQHVPSDTRPSSRLVVEDKQVFVNEPLSLVIGIENARGDESVLLDGLARGSTLSAGTAVSLSGWQLPSGALRGLFLYAPKDFVGVMNANVDLLENNKSVLDSRAVQFRWIVKQPKPVPPVAAAIAKLTTAGHVGGTGSAARLPTIAPIAPKIAPIDPDEASMLMQRGYDSLNTGDISAARVAFGRLADAGDAQATLALASTYDPNYLTAHNFLGVQGDRATARALYQQARQLGSAEAARILARMAGK